MTAPISNYYRCAACHRLLDDDSATHGDVIVGCVLGAISGACMGSAITLFIVWVL